MVGIFLYGKEFFFLTKFLAGGKNLIHTTEGHMLYLTHTEPAEVSAEETVWCYDPAKLSVYCHYPRHCDTMFGTRRDREREQDLY